MTLTDDLFALPDVLPPPASGRTPERFRDLWQIATRSPSLARLAEAHYDGAAILHEAGRKPQPGARYAVWAANGPQPATITPTTDGARLTGTKHWCSGASIATHALVVARHGETNALVRVDLHRPGVTLLEPTWQSPAFAATDTRTVAFDLPLDDTDLVADDNWYVTRPGFWHGAVGVAASWAGCAAGIVDRLTPTWPSDPHALAHLGAVDASIWALRTIIDAAAADIDHHQTATSPHGDHTGRRRALRVRHLVDTTIAQIIDHTTRATGPRPLVHQPDIHTHLAELDLYRRQCHAERDLEHLGQLTHTHHERGGQTPDANGPATSSVHPADRRYETPPASAGRPTPKSA